MRFSTIMESILSGGWVFPYRARGINIISIAIDAPQDEISSLAGKLGNIHGISVKTAYSKVTDEG